jgi:hypothetical protein
VVLDTRLEKVRIAPTPKWSPFPARSTSDELKSDHRGHVSLFFSSENAAAGVARLLATAPATTYPFEAGGNLHSM